MTRPFQRKVAAALAFALAFLSVIPEGNLLLHLLFFPHPISSYPFNPNKLLLRLQISPPTAQMRNLLRTHNPRRLT